MNFITFFKAFKDDLELNYHFQDLFYFTYKKKYSVRISLYINEWQIAIDQKTVFLVNAKKSYKENLNSDLLEFVEKLETIDFFQDYATNHKFYYVDFQNWQIIPIECETFNERFFCQDGYVSEEPFKYYDFLLGRDFLTFNREEDAKVELKTKLEYELNKINSEIDGLNKIGHEIDGIKDQLLEIRSTLDKLHSVL